MGRGDGQSKASGSSLLFGPRAPKLMSKERKKEVAVERRKLTVAATKSNYTASLQYAAQVLIDNDNPQSLIDLLKADPPKGTKGLEKTVLEDIATQIEGTCGTRSNASHPQPQTDKKETLEAIQLLRKRLIERRATSRSQDQVVNALMVQADALASKAIKEKIRPDADSIGPLPQVLSGDDYSNHLVNEKGEVLCGTAGADKSAWNTYHEHETVLTSELDCDECIKKMQTAKIEMVEPNDWIERIGSSDDLYWSLRRAFGYNGPDDDLDADSIIATGIQSGYETLNENLARIGKGPLP